MTAASKVPLTGDLDGPSLRAALGRLSDLPFMVGQVHSGQKLAAKHSSCHMQVVLLSS